MYRHGWAGFSTRYWLVGDHDPCIAYLAKSAWDRDTTPEAVYRDQVAALWGADCVDDMLTVFRELEAATVTLEWHGMGLTFPVPGMMMKHWTPGAFPAELVEVRERYREALRAAQRVAAASPPRGRDDATTGWGDSSSALPIWRRWKRFAARPTPSTSSGRRTPVVRRRWHSLPRAGRWRPMLAWPATNRTGARLRR